MRNLTVVDIRRMNVALTRARASLFVRGIVLERSDMTRKDIMSDARERACLLLHMEMYLLASPV